MFSSIYIKVTLAFAVFTLLSGAVFAEALLQKNFLLSLIAPIFFGMLSSAGFLYLFSHDDFLSFAKAIEKKEEKEEKILLSHLRHSGKIFTTILIGTIAGPVFSALTARILLSKYKYKYLLVILISIPASVFTIGIAKGIIALF